MARQPTKREETHNYRTISQERACAAFHLRREENHGGCLASRRWNRTLHSRTEKGNWPVRDGIQGKQDQAVLPEVALPKCISECLYIRCKRSVINTNAVLIRVGIGAKEQKSVCCLEAGWRKFHVLESPVLCGWDRPLPLPHHFPCCRWAFSAGANAEAGFFPLGAKIHWGFLIIQKEAKLVAY